MAVYFLLNCFIFVLFNIHVHQTMTLTRAEHLDYFFDNLFMMTLIFVLAYNQFNIYQRVVHNLDMELIRREKIETALRSVRSLLSSTINSMPSVIIGIDRHCRILLWSAAAEQMTGITKTRALGKQLYQIMPQLSAFEHTINGVIKEKVILKKNKVPHFHSEQERFMDITTYPLTNNDDEGAVIRMDDISERIKMEAALIQNEKMLTIGGLAAGLAHEINNPLAGIIQNAQVLDNRLNKDMPANTLAAEDLGIPTTAIKAYAEKRGLLKQIHHISTAAKRAVKIIDNMLGFASKVNDCRRAVSLELLLESTVELAYSDYGLKKENRFHAIEIVRDFATQLPSVNCEPSKIQQVLFNLLKNAAQAMTSAEGHIDNPRIVLKLHKEDGMVWIAVQDNGPGMKPEVVDRVFEPFFTTKKAGKGTGLGLAIAYFITVEDHGGIMRVESDGKSGTGFIIGLPVS